MMTVTADPAVVVADVAAVAASPYTRMKGAVLEVFTTSERAAFFIAMRDIWWYNHSWLMCAKCRLRLLRKISC